MTIFFAIVLIVHALVHLVGVAKAFELAELPQLTQPISASLGMLWLTAAVLCVATAVSLFVCPRHWWMVGNAALLVSMIAIASSWSDGKFGLVPNAILLTGILFGFLAYGPYSLRTEYDRDRSRLLSMPFTDQTVTDADLSHLPPAVQRYLRLTGAVGRPRVHDFRVRMHGRIRSGPDARWMPLSAEQFNFLTPSARLFYLTASTFGIPIQGYHRYVGTAASMRVKAAAVMPVAAASGPEMTQGETVTLFNDMCIFAPATLIDPDIRWEIVDTNRVKARFSRAANVIQAELWFDPSGKLVDFVSDDRYQTSPDGKTFRRVRWSTPVHGYRAFGAAFLVASGEARWQEPEGDYSYIEITIDDVEYNVAEASPQNG